MGPWAAMACILLGQTGAPSGENRGSEPPREQPGAVRSESASPAEAAAPSDAIRTRLKEIQPLLDAVSDNVYSFDDPAFYALCLLVAEYDDPLRDGPIADSDITPWRFLMERPSDYRGRLVAVEGRLQQCFEFQVENRLGGASLFEADITSPGTGATCTIITTEDIRRIPHRSWVRGRGYFLKVRSFRTTEGTSGVGPLIVARQLQIHEGAAGSREAGGKGWQSPRNLITGGAVLLTVIWLILRQRVRQAARATTRRPPPSPERSQTERPSDRDYDWLTDQDETRSSQ